VAWGAQKLGIQYNTLSLICVSVFLFLVVFELLTIVSVQDQKINALAQLVAILMEKQKLADPEHRPEVQGDREGQAGGERSKPTSVHPSFTRETSNRTLVK
jgi:hypothetical protein